MEDIEKLKQLIGTQCMVIDPMSKKGIFEPATVKNITIHLERNYLKQFDTIIRYEVILHKLTRSKKNRYGEIHTYNRNVMVSGDRIKFE